MGKPRSQLSNNSSNNTMEEEQQYDEQEQEQEQQQEVEQEVEQEQYQEEEVQQEEQVEEYKEPEQAQQNYGGNVDVPASLKAAQDDIYSDNNTISWFTTKLVDPKLKDTTLKMDQAGNGGLNELKDVMAKEADNIVFFMLRVNTYDAESSVRAKFVYGRFVGSKVKFMQKAKLTPCLGAMADQFQVKHLSKDCDETMKDWTPEKLAKEFLRIGGAHKPSKYDFGPNAVYEVSK